MTFRQTLSIQINSNASRLLLSTVNFLVASLLTATLANAQVEQGTDFSYQGQLKFAGQALNDTADFEFRLWDAATGGNTVSSILTANNVLVEDGLFMVNLDFGVSTFNGDARWLEIAVRSPAGTGAFSTLDPRQPLSAAPYALALRGLKTIASGDSSISESWNIIGGHSANNVGANVGGATIAGGGSGSFVNSVTGRFGTIGGGYGNTAEGTDSTIGGGSNNDATGTFSVVGGGATNVASGLRSTVAGGYGNTANGSQTTIGGGSDNNASGQRAVVGGGTQNTASGSRSTIAGGGLNTASDENSTVGGGFGNVASEIYATIGGGDDNVASGDAATVAGGELNIAQGDHSTVGGGEDNQATGDMSTIGGGFGNEAPACSTIGGGVNNFAGGQDSTIGGGASNFAQGGLSIVAGGTLNNASGLASTIGGGFDNEASGSQSTIPGGTSCQAGGDFSFAAGRQAIVRDEVASGDDNGDEGTFVWSDSSFTDFTSTGPDQFLIRAAGGVGIGTNDPDNQLSVLGNSDFASSGNDTVVIENTGSGRGLRAFAPEDTAVWAITDTGFAGVHGRNARDTGRAIYGEATDSTGTNYGVYGRSNSPSGYDFYAGGAGVNYGASSSQRWKNNVEPIGDPLDKLSQLRGVYFDWDEQHGGARDVGMIAEEVGKVLPEIVQFEENGVDASGMDYSKVSPLLVEAVNALRAEKDREIESLRADHQAELSQLRERMVELERLVKQLAEEGAK